MKSLYITAIQRFALRNVFVFETQRMDQHHIGFPFRRHRQRLAGPNCNGLHPITGLLFEKRN